MTESPTGRQQLGVVVGGSLTKSLEVRLDPGRSAALGHYVMAPLGDGAEVLGMVTDIILRSAEAGSISWPPPSGDDLQAELLRDVLLDTGVYTAVEVNPYLEVNRHTGETARARRLPRHFAAVSLAGQEALDVAFNTGDRAAIRVGTPLGMEDVELFIDLEKLFERSAGIFGKSGTGKTFLALPLLDAMIANSSRAPTNRDRTVALVFDMHNDYGYGVKAQGEGERPSLKRRHPSAVAVYTLEDNVPNSDGRIVVGTRDIEPEDLRILQDSAYFTDQAIEASFDLRTRFGAGWLDELLNDEPSEAVVRAAWRDGDEPEDLSWNRVATRIGIHTGSFDSLRRGLRTLARREFVDKGSKQFSGSIATIVQMLQAGKSCVIQFGKHGNDLTSYMLIANMLSRRIWEEYRDDMEKARGDTTKEPNRLVIVIEEAHKFIDKTRAGHSIFGQIARELRKYNVTLLVIDQRPSQIDSEVLSQIGTRFCLQLDSEADVEAMVGGMQGRAGLKQVIASLESKQQALVYGHALPMPVVVRPPDLPRDALPGASLRERLAVVGGRPLQPVTPSGLFGPRSD
ncbi:MAG: helicase HerA domain-containing protein [Tepidiformaceae bacterium]